MNMSRKLLLLSCILLLALPSLTRAAPNATFQIQHVEDGRRLKLSVKAIGVDDLYAYDLKLSFDADKWKLIHSSSAMQGFTVPAKTEGNRLRFAHTQIGGAAGKNGDVGLASFVFQRIEDGASDFELIEAKLVDSEIESKLYQPNLTLSGKETPSGGAQLTDIEGHWAEALIKEAALQGFVTGYEDGTFRPLRQVTRAEFAVMLMRALNVAAMNEPDADQPFADDSTIPAWARGFAAAGQHAGLLKGYDDGTFRPGQDISRIELAEMTVRSLDSVNRATPATTMQDYQAIPGWGKAAANAALASGLMKGKDGNLFDPNSYTNRAEAITVIMRLLKIHLRYEDLG